MANIIAYFRKRHHTIYSLIVSVLLALWFNGISGILNYYLPDRGLYLSLLLAIIPLIIFIVDDGNLDELYKPPERVYAGLSAAANRSANNSNFVADMNEKFRGRNIKQN